MKNLKEKVAVITGGAGDIGFSLAKELGKEGCKLVIADRRSDDAKACAQSLVQQGYVAIGVACDIREPQQINSLCDKAWETYGGVDLLFANAGVMGLPGPFLEASPQDAKWMFDVNYFGTWHTLQAFGKRFVEQDNEAHIIVTGSETSICLPGAGMAGYLSTKHAILGMTDTLRAELPEHVKISLFCPGMVQTGLSSAGADREQKDGGPVVDPFGGKLPFGMSPDRVAQHCIEQVKKDTYLIFTHYSNKYMVEERYEEMIAAFNDQTHEEEGWEQFDTRKIIAQVELPDA